MKMSLVSTALFIINLIKIFLFRNSNNSTICNSSCSTQDSYDGTCKSPEKFYFENVVLGTDKADWETGDLGGIKWDLCLCLLLAWIIVCACLIRGKQQQDKNYKDFPIIFIRYQVLWQSCVCNSNTAIGFPDCSDNVCPLSRWSC